MNTLQDIQLDYLPRLPQDRSLTIGCIGSGFIMADCHLVAYRQAGFNPVAIASRNKATARQSQTGTAFQKYMIHTSSFLMILPLL